METFILILFIFSAIASLLIIFPFVKTYLTIRGLKRMGKDRAGNRSIDQILEEMNFHDFEHRKCQGELLEILNLTASESVSKPTDVKITNEPKPVKLTFNSKEIGCIYQGLELPKYVKNEDNVWFEFESIALFDKNNKAIVDDATKNYITIHDFPTKSSFFYRQIIGEPTLGTEITD